MISMEVMGFAALYPSYDLLHSPSPQQSFPGMIELQPDAIRILEQQRVVAGCPLILARRANNLRADRGEELV
jgi:hypothetical protein